MKASEEFQRVLAAYQEDLQRLADSLRPGDGILGFGRKPGDDPCHERFDEETAKLAESWAQPSSDREEAAELARRILRCDQELTLPVYAQVMLIAIQRHVLLLIPRLTEPEAREIRLWFEKQYPYFRRVPVQQEILKALKAKSGGR